MISDWDDGSDGSGPGSGSDGADGSDGSGSGSGSGGAASNDPTLVGLIASILSNNYCQSIDFYWAGFHPSGPGYSQVLSALQNSPPTLFATRDNVGDYGARFNVSTNTILVASSWNNGDVVSELTMLHECTHALQALANNPVNDDAEAAAYLAGALYCLYYQNGSATLPGTPTPIIAASLKVATNVWHNQGQAVASNTMQPLLDALKTNPH
jgi:hypothetical protein